MKKKHNNYIPYCLKKQLSFSDSEIGLEESMEMFEFHFKKYEKLRQLFLEKTNSSVNLEDDVQRNAFFAGVEFQMCIGEYLDKRRSKQIQ